MNEIPDLSPIFVAHRRPPCSSLAQIVVELCNFCIPLASIARQPIAGRDLFPFLFVYFVSMCFFLTKNNKIEAERYFAQSRFRRRRCRIAIVIVRFSPSVFLPYERTCVRRLLLLLCNPFAFTVRVKCLCLHLHSIRHPRVSKMLDIFVYKLQSNERCTCIVRPVELKPHGLCSSVCSIFRLFKYELSANSVSIELHRMAGGK